MDKVILLHNPRDTTLGWIEPVERLLRINFEVLKTSVEPSQNYSAVRSQLLQINNGEFNWKRDLLVLPVWLIYKEECALVEGMGGLSFLNHVRLEKDIRGTRSGIAGAIAVLLSVQSMTTLLAQNARASILAAPGTAFVQLPVTRDNLQHTIERAYPLTSEAQHRKLISSYIEPTLRDHLSVKHNYLNQIGPDRLAVELISALTNDEYLLGNAENDLLGSMSDCDLAILDNLQMKRLRFYDDLSINETCKPALIKELRELAAGKRILYIDDEYNKWIPVLRHVLSTNANLPARDVIISRSSVLPNHKISETLCELYCCGVKEHARDFTDRMTQSQDFIAQELADKGVSTRRPQHYDTLGLKTSGFNAVLLDLRLSPQERFTESAELSGFKLFKSIREHFPWMPVVIFTASEKASNARYYVEHGASYWIKGSDNLEELAARIIDCFNFRENQKVPLLTLWLKLKGVERRGSFKFLSFILPDSSFDWKKAHWQFRASNQNEFGICTMTLQLLLQQLGRITWGLKQSELSNIREQIHQAMLNFRVIIESCCDSWFDIKKELGKYAKDETTKISNIYYSGTNYICFEVLRKHCNDIVHGKLNSLSDEQLREALLQEHEWLYISINSFLDLLLG